MQRKLSLLFLIVLQTTIAFSQRKPIVIQPNFNAYDPANRALYEQYIESHPFATRQHYNKQELKGMPKADRPDLAWEQDFLRTMDPGIGRPAPERLVDAYEIVEQYQANMMGIPGSAAIPWVERGPNNVGGRTRAIVFDPNDVLHKKVWAGGVTGGLWYNTDITNSSSQWTAVNDFWNNLAITAIAFDPNNSQIMYVGTGEGFGTGSSRGEGVWKSTDGGATFSQLSATSDYYYVNDLVVRNESGTSVLYVGVSEMYYQGAYQGTATYFQGMFRSTNGGTSFTQVMPSTGTAGSYYAPVDIEIAANNRIWVATRRNSFGAGGGVIMYSDNGTSWTVSTDRGTNARVEIACAPSSANTIYAVVESSGTVEEIIKTTNGGTTWVSSSSSATITEPADADNGIPNGDFTRGQAWYDLICEVDPVNANTLYVGGIDLFRSTNAGLTWTQISKWSNNNNLAALSCPLVHADQHAFVFRPGANNEAVIGNDGGIYYASTLSGASNSGSAISHRVSNYNVTQFYACAMSPTANSNVFLAGAQDNGTQRYTNVGVNATTQVNGGDGAYCFIDQTNSNQAIASYVYNSYYYSSDGGASFGTTLLADQNTGSFINPADYDDNMNILYSCKDVSSIYRVSGVGSTPSTATVSISGMTARATNIKVSPFTTTSTKLFIGTSGGSLYRVTNANIGTSPTVANITGSSFPNASISSIEFGANENTIIVTFFNYGVTSVWYTTNGGTSWVSKEGNLPDMPVRWSMMSPTSNNEVILATEVGVWSTSNFQSTSPTWVPSNSGLANVRVDMLQMRTSDSEVLAATYGRGLFSSSYLSAVCSYPTALTASNVGASTADLSWTAGATETSWNLQYGLAGFSLGSGTSVTPTTTSYSLSGLQTGYTYEFYVQANCGGGSVSAWAGPYSFTTVCGPITSFPYTMDFENGSPCWTILNGGDANTWVVTSGQGISSSYSANIEYSSTAHDDHLISPQFTVTNGTSNQFRFSAMNYSSQWPENFSVLVSTSGNSSSNFTDTIAQNVFPTTSFYTEYVYDLSAYNGQAIYVSIYSNTTDEWLLFIDNVVIDAPCAVYNNISVSACNSYTWAATGATYTTSGTHYDTLVAASGCDSILVLNLTINSSNSGSQSLTACNSYTWPASGLTYTSSGAYMATVTNAAGCDSVATLNLTINGSLSSSSNVTACNTYLWPANNVTYTSSGTYNTTLTSAGGCDSIVTLNLTINGSLSSSSTVSACNTYLWPANNATYTSSGTYNTTLTSAGGCDSIVTLNLTINISSSGSENVNSCSAYTWPANGQTYTTSGSYTATVTNAAGCDSVATLNLSLNSTITGSQTVAQCVSYTWPANSVNYTSSGVYTTTLTSAGGCDSIVTLNLTIYPNSTSSSSITACNSYTWPVNNQTYTASGSYSQVLTNQNGCDSTVTLNLTIHNNTASAAAITACDSLISPSGNSVWFSSGTYVDTLVNSNGCDSILTVNLTINNTQNTAQTMMFCNNGPQFTAGGQAITGTGQYVDVLTASTGCDSIITTTVTGDTQLPNVITQNATAYLDASGNASITAAQVDNGSSDNCGIASMTLNQSTFTCADLGANVVMLTVVDQSGNSNAGVAVVTVIDTISPQIASQTDTVYLNQSGHAAVSFASLNAGSTDNCGIASSFVFPNVFHCAHANTLQTVYCSVTDSSGNDAASSIQVYIADTLAPIIESDSAIAYLDATGNVVLNPMDVSSVSDNCTLDSVWLSNSSFSCNQVNTYQNVNVFSQDANGNIASKQVLVLIKDTNAPTIAANAPTVQLNAAGNGTLAIANVDAGSFDNCAITSQTLSKTAFNCSDQGMNEVLYTVQDISGNSSSVLVSVNVVDNVNAISGFTSSGAAPTYTNVTYSVNPLANATYNWSVTNGILNSQSGSSAVVTWYYYSQGTIQVIQTTENGCSDTLVKNITLWPLGDLEIETNATQFEFYPNPSHGDVNLVMTRGELPSKMVDLTVFDVAGNVVLTEESVNLNLGEVHCIATRQLAKGLYFLKLENEDGSQVVRFILQ